MIPAEFIPVVLLFGLAIGSFLSVCIYRIPRSEGFYTEEENETPPVLKGFNEPKRSICPNCQNQLKWWHNIPVLSWFLLGGKCGFCRVPISSRYVFVELLTAGAALLSATQYGFTPTAGIVFFYVAALIVITFIDYDYFIIPNIITIPGFLVGLGVAALSQLFPWFTDPIVPDLLTAFWGILAGAGFLYAISEIYLKVRKAEGLGMGDVKLLAMTGVLFGPGAALYTIFIGSLFGSLLGILLIVLTRRKFSQHLPFGPYLALGSVLYLFLGIDGLSQLIEQIKHGVSSLL